MVLLHVKSSDDASFQSHFLLEALSSELVGAVARRAARVSNLRQRVGRVGLEGRELGRYGTADKRQPEEMQGLDEEMEAMQGLSLSSEKETRGPFYTPDPTGPRTGAACDPNTAITLTKTATLEAAETLALRKQVEAGTRLTEEELQFNFTEMDEETATLWWAGKQMLRENKLSDYVGKNEKTKIVVKLQKKGAAGAAPVTREPVRLQPTTRSTIPPRGGDDREYTVEDHRVVEVTSQAGGAVVTMRVTLLAAGFVIGARGASARQIGQVTGAVVQSWTDSLDPDNATRMFKIQGKKQSVKAAVDLIAQAVQLYKDLCESKRRGEFVQRVHTLASVEFTYQPPPRKALLASGPADDHPAYDPEQLEALFVPTLSSNGQTHHGLNNMPYPTQQHGHVHSHPTQTGMGVGYMQQNAWSNGNPWVQHHHTHGGSPPLKPSAHTPVNAYSSSNALQFSSQYHPGSDNNAIEAESKWRWPSGDESNYLAELQKRAAMASQARVVDSFHRESTSVYQQQSYVDEYDFEEIERLAMMPLVSPQKPARWQHQAVQQLPQAQHQQQQQHQQQTAYFSGLDELRLRAALFCKAADEQVRGM
eukprot:jgi/Chlat1/2309/Chrsp17S00168